MGERIIDLSRDIKSGMVANRDFAGNIFVPLISHEQPKLFMLEFQEIHFCHLGITLG